MKIGEFWEGTRGLTHTRIGECALMIDSSIGLTFLHFDSNWISVSKQCFIIGFLDQFSNLNGF